MPGIVDRRYYTTVCTGKHLLWVSVGVESAVSESSCGRAIKIGDRERFCVSSTLVSGMAERMLVTDA